MHIPKDAKIEKAISKAADRPVLQQPYLKHRDDGSSVLYASDGRIVAIVPVEDATEDLQGTVHIEAIKAARKGSCVVRCEDKYVIAENEVAYPRNENYTDNFPPVETLLRSKQDTEYEIAFSAKALYDLVQSLGADVVKLRFGQPNEPITIIPHAGAGPVIHGAKGVLMPYIMQRSV